VLIEVEPTLASPIVAGCSAAAEVIAAWVRDNATSGFPPLVVHLTRGRHEAAEVEAAFAVVANAKNRHGACPVVYHQVVTESPHASVVYPVDDQELTDPSLKALFHAASPVLGCEQLMQRIPSLKSGARGFVVNGKMDIVWRTLEQAIEA
jgi:hypothetical protein